MPVSVGGLVLVRPQPTAENQNIVVAMVEGEATLKRFFREKDAIRLQPENSSMAPIIIPAGSSDVTIIGKVVGVYRDKVETVDPKMLPKWLHHLSSGVSYP